MPFMPSILKICWTTDHDKIDTPHEGNDKQGNTLNYFPTGCCVSLAHVLCSAARPGCCSPRSHYRGNRQATTWHLAQTGQPKQYETYLTHLIIIITPSQLCNYVTINMRLLNAPFHCFYTKKTTHLTEFNTHRNVGPARPPSSSTSRHEQNGLHS